MVRPDYEPRKRKCWYCREDFHPPKKDSKFCCRTHYLLWIKEGGRDMSPEEAEWRTLTPEERWDKMSDNDLSIENLRFHFSYGKSQVKRYTNSLPEDFGLGEKVLERMREINEE